MTGIAFVVVGTPAPKGSFRVIARGRGGRPLARPRVLKDSPRTDAWHELVAWQARAAMAGREPFAGVALRVEIVFRIDRPAGHLGKRGVRPSAPEMPAVKPDLDKLARATLDPLEGVVFDGDSRVVDLVLAKRYAVPGHPAGATISIRRARDGA